jgi:tol-pal system protein YbgF
MRRHLVLSALAAVVLAGVLTVPAPGPAQSTDELRGRLNAIERELADIRARSGLPPGGAAAGGALGDVTVRLDRLEAQIRELTGKVERLEFEQRRIAEDAARRFGDIEFRLTELEGGDPSALAPVPPLGGVGSVGSPPVAAAGAVSISERNDLDRAIEDVRQGRYDLAEDRLRGFLTAYPDSPLEGEARYWLGESQFIRGAYQNAARSYLEGYKSDEAGPAAARNLYGLGVTLGRLGQVNEACLTLAEVMRKFAGGPAEVVGKAREEANALGCG